LAACPCQRIRHAFRPSTGRRAFLKAAAAGPALLAAPAGLAAAPSAAIPTQPTRLAPNSIALADLPGHYDVETGIHNLENGYWGVMPRVVAEEYVRQTLYVNRMNAIWARNVLPGGDCLAAGGRERAPPSRGWWAARPTRSPSPLRARMRWKR
jgi:hypothetical protein